MNHKTKTLALIALIVGLFLTFNQTINAQSALDGFDPNPSMFSTIRVIVLQPNGKILIGGDFQSIGGQASNNIARLNADGSLDTTFNPSVGNIVYSIAVQPDGKILIGGNFLTIGTATRNYIARLNADGTLDTAFDPNANNVVNSIAVQPDGKILIGGSFTTISATTRNRIARLNADGTLDTAFNPSVNTVNPNASVNSIVVQPNGRILIGGDFQSIGTTTRNNIARLNTDGSLDTAFNSSADNIVRSIAVQPDGKILIGGDFQSINTTTRSNIARLNTDGSLDTAFNSSADNTVRSIAVQPDGKILIGGSFQSINMTTRNRIARLNADGSLDTAFNPNASFAVQAIAVQSDGKILIGGSFTTIGTTTRNYVARLERDGSLDQTLNINAVGTAVYATAVQPDGKIIIGGLFTSILGVTRNNIARLNADGTLDMTFDPNANSSGSVPLGVNSLAIQADGMILAGGDFTTIGGQTRRRLARLDSTTGAADAFDPNVNGAVNSIVVQPDGKILIGGVFTTIGGTGGVTRNRLARLDPATGVPDTFDPNSDQTVRTLAVQQDGKILVGGNFANVGGQPRSRLARLNPDGTLDGFNPVVSSNVYATAIQSDGKILIGGVFVTVNGVSRRRIARLDPVTGVPDAFDPNADSNVNAIAIQSDGKVVIGGQFILIGGAGGATRNRVARLDGTTGIPDAFDPNADGFVNSLAVLPGGKILTGGAFANIGGQPRNLFARLSNDTAALSTLTVTKTTVTLTRDGSAPQFERVVFEQSLDNGATYTTLGTAMNTRPALAADSKNDFKSAPDAPTASGYTLSGLNLPYGQNILIRARGFYRAGYQNGSEISEDKLQNVFLLAPSAASVSVSGKVQVGSFGLTNAVVTLTDLNGETRTARTSSFGNYRFEDVAVGQSYVITVSSRRYFFAPQIINVNEEIGNLNFNAH